MMIRPGRFAFPATCAGVLLAMSLGFPNDARSDKASSGAFSYPDTRKADHVDEYHGTKVPDPYRWLEDPDSPETRAWVEAQNKVTMPYLESLPYRAKLKERLTKLWNYPKFSAPGKEGDRYFYSHNTGLQNQSVLFTIKSLEGEPKQLLDPNTLSTDGTVALSGLSVSHDGKLLAYGLAAAGSDWNEWKIRDVETGKDLDDHLKWIKFSGASWTRDGSGFFYGRFPEPKAGENLKGANFYNKIYFHKVGTPQSEDQLVFERPEDKEWLLGAEVSDDGHYVLISARKGTSQKERVFYKDLTDKDAKPVELIDKFEYEFSFIDNDGPVFYFKTNRDAPKGRVVAIDTRKPAPADWVTIIPEVAETLDDVDLVGGHFIASYLKDARTQVKLFDTKGKLVREVELPGIGTASGFRGKKTDTETFYTFTSFNRPATVLRYDIASGKSEVFRKIPLEFNPDDYETTQVFYTSKDGTKVPMFITAKKGLEKNGQNPTLLYAYGGFNISLTPSFSPANLAWMEMGGVLAIPNLRGGGEYGEEWHQGGTKLKKQNVFDDFIAAAEYLIAEKYTKPARLAISGGSNGGLLVGACMAQRPDLYGAALPAVGVMDMLRFHKFTIGWAWVDDYGSSDNAEQFKALFAYSPLHNLKKGTKYPSTLVTTADHDDRVVPAHSFKFAATLQAAHRGENPVMIRIETKAGHGAGKPTSKLIEEAADKWAFLIKALGFEPKL